MPTARGGVTDTGPRIGSLYARIKAHKFSYFLVIPAFVGTVIFHYWPIYGIVIAFKDFSFSKGILGSPWTGSHGFQWFRVIFRDPEFINVIKNTVIISFSKLLIGTASCVLVALLLNELRSTFYKRTVQIAMYLPHFLSWVIMAGIVYNVFTISGGLFTKFVTGVLRRAPIQILAKPEYFRLILYTTHVWKTVGFGAIIYLAAIAGINPMLYEAATVDGANRFRRIWHITLPGMRPTIVILLILNMSNIMNAGFDQVYNLYSPMVLQVGDIIDTYVYRHGIQLMEYSYAAAIDLFKQVINIALLLTVNKMASLLGQEGLY